MKGTDRESASGVGFVSGSSSPAAELKRWASSSWSPSSSTGRTSWRSEVGLDRGLGERPDGPDGRTEASEGRTAGPARTFAQVRPVRRICLSRRPEFGQKRHGFPRFEVTFDAENELQVGGDGHEASSLEASGGIPLTTEAWKHPRSTQKERLRCRASARDWQVKRSPLGSEFRACQRPRP